MISHGDRADLREPQKGSLDGPAGALCRFVDKRSTLVAAARTDCTGGLFRDVVGGGVQHIAGLQKTADCTLTERAVQQASKQRLLLNALTL
jgi:hypothetical protein